MLITIPNILIFLIANFHLWICIIEMFFWEKPLGRKIFKLDADFSSKTAAFASNQGLYNAFLAAGLFWSLLVYNPVEAFHLKVFFLGCITLAGIFGGFTLNKRIFIRQGMPAFVTLILVLMSNLNF